MAKQKLNMAIGRFQPFTQGHLNMVNEGDGPCIVYRINSSDKSIETTKTGIKIGSKKYPKDAINNVINYIDNPEGNLSEVEKELLKRPFTNELIDEELEIVKKNNKNIIDVIPVTHVYDALGRFNAFITEHSDEYEVGDWMCGDDRKDDYESNVEKMSKYTDLEIEFKSGKTLPNILIGKLKVNTGKGRTEGVSGTEVRKSILTNNKSKFESIMPKGVGKMFDDFTKAFDEFKNQLQKLIKENKILKNYIANNMKSIKDIIIEANESKDKTFKELKSGDTIYYVSPYSNSRKIESAKITKKIWHESHSMGGYWFSEMYEFKIHLNTQNKEQTFIVSQKDFDKNIYIDCGLKNDGSYYGAYSSDRTLLDEYQEKLVDDDIKELQKEIDNFNKEYEEKKTKLENKYNELVNKKLEKYDD